MGACASCGAYGGSQHRPTCGPREGERIRLNRSRWALFDGGPDAPIRAWLAGEYDITRQLLRDE